MYITYISYICIDIIHTYIICIRFQASNNTWGVMGLGGHIIEQHPSKTTTRLVAGLMAGTSERAVSANRCVQTSGSGCEGFLVRGSVHECVRPEIEQGAHSFFFVFITLQPRAESL